MWPRDNRSPQEKNKGEERKVVSQIRAYAATLLGLHPEVNENK